MTIPFWCLLIAVFMPYVLSGIAVQEKRKQLGDVDNHDPRAQAAQLRGRGARAVAAQANAWEALAVFSVSVLVAHLAGASASGSAVLAVAFVAARVSHAACYLNDWATPRSLSFFVGTLCCLGLFVLAASA